MERLNPVSLTGQTFSRGCFSIASVWVCSFDTWGKPLLFWVTWRLWPKAPYNLGKDMQVQMWILSVLSNSRWGNIYAQSATFMLHIAKKDPDCKLPIISNSWSWKNLLQQLDLEDWSCQKADGGHSAMGMLQFTSLEAKRTKTIVNIL